MCKEIKRLTDLSQCQHLSKTDRDALKWALQQIDPETIAGDNVIGNLCFDDWASKPSAATAKDFITYRKAKGAPLTQSAVNLMSGHIEKGLSNGKDADYILGYAMEKGWRSLKWSWIAKDLGEDAQSLDKGTVADYWNLIKTGAITKVSELPSNIRAELESKMKFGAFKKESSIKLLTDIGLAI